MIEPFSLLLIGLIALLGSFGHCIGMCGGLVIAYSTAKIDRNYDKTKTVISHILYHLGRTSTYVFISLLFGALGGLVARGISYEVSLIVGGGVVILFSAYLGGLSGIFKSFEYNLSKTIYFKKLFSKLISAKSLSSFFYLGLLNGLLPCGFANIFFALSFAFGDVWTSLAIGLILGVFSAPILFYMGISHAFLREAGFRSAVSKITAFLAFALGVYTIAKGVS